MPRTVLLTGATGFIGSRIASLLEKRGYAIRCFSRRPQKESRASHFFQGDLTDPESCRRSMDGVTYVVHAAGEKRNPDLYWVVNSDGTRNLLDAALTAGVRRFVHVSSIGVVGADPLRPRVVTEEDPCLPRNGYECSKQAAEERVCGAAAQGLETAILRPANVFGEGDTGQGLLTLIRSVKQGFFAYLGGRASLSNYVYVGDVAVACLSLLEDPRAAGRVFHLSDDCLLVEFVSEIADRLGVAKPALAMPEPLAGLMRGLLHQGERLGVSPGSALMGRLRGLNNRVRYPSLRLQRELGWRYRIGWRQGLEKLIGFYRQEGLL